MKTRTTLLAAAVLASAPAAAQAAPVLTAPLKPCYVSVYSAGLQPQREAIALSATGFRPGSTVSVRVDGVVEAANVLTDAAGAFAGTVPSPFLERGSRPFDIEVFQDDDPAQRVVASSRVAALGVALRPRVARPTQRITFAGRGFTILDRPVFAHYVKKGRARRTIRLGMPDAPCGTFKVRRKQFPFRPSTGRWLLQIDQERRYTRRPDTAFMQFDVDVQPTVGG